MRYCRFLLIALIISGGIAFPENLFSYWIWTPKTGRWINPKYHIKDTPREQFEWAESFAKDGDSDTAIRKHEQLIKCYPTSSDAATSQYRIGELYLEKGKGLRAFWTFQKVIENYPRTSLINEIVAEEFEIANSFFDHKRKRLIKIPITTSVKTAELFEKIVENEPFGKYAAESQYKSGLSYLREKNSEKAKEALQKVIDNYPKTKWAEEASYQLIHLSLKKSPKIATDLTSLEETIDKCKEFKRTFPESKKGEEAESIIENAHQKEAEKLYQIGLFYEKRRERKATIIYYEKIIRLYPQTEVARTAEERLKKLK
ncbi:MAG: outer membrane protein assembly factor BamD [Candidatus Omnitrophica bacterium]|nr:outer membrane protein assembly factor BamD [Candidatus Omnitrophota bacterium]